MGHKIGFIKDNEEVRKVKLNHKEPKRDVKVRKSVASVYFADKDVTFAYYNDQFDLKPGDWVYVEGKLEGVLGRVREVNYTFKIKLSDYKRVIAVVDTDVKGDFYTAGSHFVTFDRKALPKEQAALWFRAPLQEEEYESGYDDTSFSLDQLSEMNIAAHIAERGHEYYSKSKVRYLCVDGNKGYALVEGREAYEVEFEYHERQISNLVCQCFCSYPCKHEFATMLQLRETLEMIEQHYEEKYKCTGYFAAIYKPTLFQFAVDGKEVGKITL